MLPQGIVVLLRPRLVHGGDQVQERGLHRILPLRLLFRRAAIDHHFLPRQSAEHAPSGGLSPSSTEKAEREVSRTVIVMASCVSNPLICSFMNKQVSAKANGSEEEETSLVSCVNRAKFHSHDTTVSEMTLRNRVCAERANDCASFPFVFQFRARITETVCGKLITDESETSSSRTAVSSVSTSQVSPGYAWV
ncbi:unnamed protein product [Lampetra fluviatilis]